MRRHYIAPYDYSYSAGKFVKGGDLKMLALLQGTLSDKVAFNPPFNRLIADLAAHLRAHYIKIDPSDLELLELSTRTITELERAPEAQLEMARRYRDGNPGYRISMSLQRLKMRHWLVKTMQGHLAAPDWLPDDSARPQGLHLTCNSKKRPCDGEDSPTEGPSRSKVERKAPYLKVSSSRVPFRSDSSGVDALMEGEDEDLFSFFNLSLLFLAGCDSSIVYLLLVYPMRVIKRGENGCCWWRRREGEFPVVKQMSTWGSSG